ncbi:MAG: Uncharacterised protein [Methanobacteriota archaeon]|nr:MAG: Uncharacterised protein [Euryarchaeota archaeon]
MYLVPLIRGPLSTANCILVIKAGSSEIFKVAFHFISINLAHVAAPETGEDSTRGTPCIMTPCGPSGEPSSETITAFAASTSANCIPG